MDEKSLRSAGLVAWPSSTDWSCFARTVLRLFVLFFFFAFCDIVGIFEFFLVGFFRSRSMHKSQLSTSCHVALPFPLFPLTSLLSCMHCSILFIMEYALDCMSSSCFRSHYTSTFLGPGSPFV